MRGAKIFKSDKFDSINIIRNTQISVIKSNELQAPYEGGLIYDPNFKDIYYADGTQWLPLSGISGTVTSITSGVGLNSTPNPITTIGTIDLANTAVTPGVYGSGGNIPQITVDQQGRLTSAINIPIASSPGASTTFSLLKSGTQSIPPMVNTIINNWVISPNPPYHDNTGKWNLLTGVYTANMALTIYITISLSWLEGISNLGNRAVRIIYKPSVGAPLVAKESVTQADPNTDIATTQETGIALSMNTGDQTWVEVNHTAAVNLTLGAGNTTTISGIEITT
ncbi:MAG TPA: hypothetical protein PKD85_01245 [Saprospiraceae bacterium]|nr:hypothetical protein [Saprospiraceae bacterium]